MAVTSSTDLKGFPMVFSYPEKMLNNAFAESHAAGSEDMFPKSFRFENTEEFYTFDASEYDAPFVTFNVPTLDQGSQLTIPVKSGSFKFWKLSSNPGGGPPIPVEDEIDISGRNLFVTVPVALRTHDDFSDARFSIQALYADLSHIEGAKVDFDSEEEAAIGTGVIVAISDVISTGLIAWAIDFEKEHGVPPTLFGGAKIPKFPFEDKDYPLRPTGCTYSVSKQMDKNGKYLWGALNLLLRMDDEKNPNGSGCGIFDFPLPKSNSDEGVLVISSYAFAKKIIMKSFKVIYDEDHDWVATKATMNQTQGTISLKEDVDLGTVGKVYKSTITAKNISAEFVEGGFCRVKHYSEGHTPRPVLPDVKHECTSFFNLKFSVQKGKLKVEQTEPEDEVVVEDGLPGWARILIGIVTIGFSEMGMASGGKAQEELLNLHNTTKTSLDTCFTDIILPGERTKVFDFSRVEVTKSPNGLHNMFLYGKFAANS